jgi:hypothetical protein
MPTARAYNDNEVEFTVEQQLPEGARMTVTDEDGTQWKLDVDSSGDYDIVASWNADGDLADVPVPDYVDDLLSRMV